MNLSWAPSRPGSRNTISKQQKGGKKTPGMTGLAETTPRPSEALFWFSALYSGRIMSSSLDSPTKDIILEHIQ